jgi:transcriptional regulator with XRE-family HTH domain
MRDENSSRSMPITWLHLARLDRGLTQFLVARAVDVSAGRYSLIERGLAVPTAEERRRLAEALKVPEGRLLERVLLTDSVQISGG